MHLRCPVRAGDVGGENGTEVAPAPRTAPPCRRSRKGLRRSINLRDARLVSCHRDLGGIKLARGEAAHHIFCSSGGILAVR